MTVMTETLTQSIKSAFHQRNRYRFDYDFNKLINHESKLSKFVFTNKYGSKTVDFSNSEVVKLLNGALLKAYHGISHWEIPDDYLCPPVPSRSEYIHYLADLIHSTPAFNSIHNDKVIGLDIGTGASCIYPLLGVSEYGWKFVGSEINDLAFKSAVNNCNMNKNIKNFVELRKQNFRSHILKNIVKDDDYYHFCMCNPPFHASLEETIQSSSRKWKNLNKIHLIKSKTYNSDDEQKYNAPSLKNDVERNFGGINNELYCEGGEKAFISSMIHESSDPFIHVRVHWFTVLVSKQSSLPYLYNHLSKYKNVKDVKTVNMEYGQKKSRFIAWTYS